MDTVDFMVWNVADRCFVSFGYQRDPAWCHSGTDVTFGGVIWVPTGVIWVPDAKNGVFGVPSKWLLEAVFLGNMGFHGLDRRKLLFRVFWVPP